MLNYNEKKLKQKLLTKAVCPICGGTRKTGHVRDCEIAYLMPFLPAQLSVGDEAYLPGYDFGEWYPCVVTKIIDDFTCELYEPSIKQYHIIEGNVITSID